MGDVVQLSDYRCDESLIEDFDVEDSLVPVEFGVVFRDRQKCLDKISEYGIRDVHLNHLNADASATLYLIGVKDAIWLNKKILEKEEISDEEIALRIDRIQMLENTNLALMETMWAAISQSSDLLEAKE